MAQSSPSAPPPRLRFDWSSWMVIAAIVLHFGKSKSPSACRRFSAISEGVGASRAFGSTG
jgi:hypothetical protein